MFLTGTISREIGVSFTLACTVSLSHRVRDSSVSIRWQGPSTDDQPTVDRFSDNTLLINELTLDPFTLAHGTHVLLYTQLMDILLLSGVWNQLFQSVS